MTTESENQLKNNYFIDARSHLEDLVTSDLPEEIDELADLLVEIELTFEQTKHTRDYLKRELSARLADKDLKEIYSRDGDIKIRRTDRTARTKFNREGLINYLRTSCSKELVDVKTGEQVTQFDAVKFMEIYLECFLPQPRWGPLEEHGVNDEDFCIVETKPTVSYSGLTELKKELVSEIESNEKRKDEIAQETPNSEAEVLKNSLSEKPPQPRTADFYKTWTRTANFHKTQPESSKKDGKKWGPDDRPLTPSEYPSSEDNYDADPQPWSGGRIGERLETAENLEDGYF